MIKRFAKGIIVGILGWQVRRLRRRQSFRVVAIAGSIGKTGTKFAVATVLRKQFSVQFQKGNYNDLVTVPLVFFGLPEPPLFNPLAWTATFLRIERQLRRPYPYEVVIVELGPDGPGQMHKFSKYLHADIGLLTAIAPEHMEFFGTLAAVAKEELVIAGLSDELIVSNDHVAAEYLDGITCLSYGLQAGADCRLQHTWDGVRRGYTVTITGQKESYEGFITALGEHQLQPVAAAVLTAERLGMSRSDIEQGIAEIRPAPGRMQPLAGINDSLIIDDSYNNVSSMVAIAALDTLYSLDHPQKIALLGNMNELGGHAPDHHRLVGEHCDPSKLDLVVTLGPQANTILAEAAEARGCRVVRTETPYEAGKIIAEQIKPGAAVLIKGSQNRVYSEEAIKPLLADPADAAKLVRQSPEWLRKKAANFS